MSKKDALRPSTSALVASVLVACSPHATTPLAHRPSAVASESGCDAIRAAGTCACGSHCPSDSQFTCGADADCASGGATARCNASSGGPAGCSCSGDACNTDSDCPADQTCACKGSGLTFGANGYNTRVPGNCRTDADCGEHGFCSPSGALTVSGVTTFGYFCHTPQDDCVNDCDCPKGSGPDFAACQYSANRPKWVCVSIPVPL